MAKHVQSIGPDHKAFIARQHVFFVASAAATGRVNLSPKGLDSLRVLDQRTVIYLDLTGSGNETAAHLKVDGRLTLMFCAFEGPPLILRLYGVGRVLARGAAEYERLLLAHFDGLERPGARQMILLDVQAVHTSCGYAIPHLAFQEERPALDNWARAKGEAGLVAYRSKNNLLSIDGFGTGFAEPEDIERAEPG